MDSFDDAWNERPPSSAPPSNESGIRVLPTAIRQVRECSVNIATFMYKWYVADLRCRLGLNMLQSNIFTTDFKTNANDQKMKWRLRLFTGDVRRYDDRPKDDRPEGDRPKEDQPEGDRPEGDRAERDRPEGNRPQAGRNMNDLWMTIQLAYIYDPTTGRRGERPDIGVIWSYSLSDEDDNELYTVQNNEMTFRWHRDASSARLVGISHPVSQLHGVSETQWSCTKFIPRSRLLNDDSLIDKKGGLRIRGQFRLFSDQRLNMSKQKVSLPPAPDEGSIQADFIKLMQDDTSADLRIIVKQSVFSGADEEEEGEKTKQFLVHEAILRARSPYFERALQCNMLERQKREFVIDDIDAVVFKEIIHYMYGGSARAIYADSESASDIAEGLLVAADKLAMDDLKATAEERLCCDVNVNNSCRRAALAAQLNAPRLRQCCVDAIASFYAYISTNADYDKLVRGFPEVIQEVVAKIRR